MWMAKAVVIGLISLVVLIMLCCVVINSDF